MEEKNKNSLKKAIDNLPKYSPEDALWDRLSNDLDNPDSDLVLQKSIRELPTYRAPDAAWANIEKELPAKRRLWPKVLLIAASFALLAGFIWNISINKFGEELVTISYQEKQVDPAQFVNLNNPNTAIRDSAFRTIVRAQRESNKRAKEILAEIQFLNESKKRLKSKLSEFDINNDLREKLEKLEKESLELQEQYLITI